MLPSVRPGGNDARVNATIPKTSELMKQANKTFEPVTYEGAGHGFLRAAILCCALHGRRA